MIYELKQYEFFEYFSSFFHLTLINKKTIITVQHQQYEYNIFVFHLLSIYFAHTFLLLYSSCFCSFPGFFLISAQGYAEICNPSVAFKRGVYIPWKKEKEKRRKSFSGTCRDLVSYWLEQTLFSVLTGFRVFHKPVRRKKMCMCRRKAPGEGWLSLFTAVLSGDGLDCRFLFDSAMEL